ncbi:MAG TPA: 23S rRNA (guanosine(2251)-2'-O)-methyltransferase RlmB [Actinomycetota bacterium]
MSRERDRQQRRRPVFTTDGTVVGGRRAVTEAIRAGRATEVLVVSSPKVTQGMQGLLDAARGADVPIRVSPRTRLDALAANHQGVVARLRADQPRARSSEAPAIDALPGTLSERDMADLEYAPDAIVVILDGITDPQNLGAAARSAEASGAALLVTRTKRAADVTAVAVRASAGALLHLPHARVANIPRAIERLQDVGFWVVGLDGAAPSSIADEPCPTGRVAIVIGSEGTGMARLVRERCDALVSLPMRGKVGSLNASASLAAVLYAWVLPTRER